MGGPGSHRGRASESIKSYNTGIGRRGAELVSSRQLHHGPSAALYRVELVPLDALRPHEMVIEERVRALAEDIARRRVLIRPILVDENTMVILDGHHRVEALRRLGARRVAALLVDYGSECVTVGSWRPGWRVTKEDVVRAGLSGRLLPPRTSRHRVCFQIPEVNVPLDQLL